MYSVTSACILLSILALATCGPLYDYVNSADSAYDVRFHSSFRGPKYTVFNINMTSQQYNVPGGVTPNLWRHWLTICVPDNLDVPRASTVNLHISSGNNGDPAPTTLLTAQYALLDRICSSTGLVSAQLGMVPNQPLVFGRDPNRTPRVEDGILAFGWAQFLNNTNTPIWITRLAMVKAAVKAMDSIQDFSKFITNCPLIKDFIISGASKRGWTTWLVPAVDNRVKAIVPMMMPIQNMQNGINAQYRCYGGFTFAFTDYALEGILGKLNSAAFRKLALIEDPINYNNDIDMPKLVIMATEDEFFLPDQAKFFFSQLKGEKHLNVIPNANHPVDEALDYDAERFYHLANITSAFINQVTRREARPVYDWKLNYSNTTASIEFTVRDGRVPDSVKLWQARSVSSTKRDFRRFGGEFPNAPVDQSALSNWVSSTLKPTRSGYYVARVTKPSQGWTAFEIEATYKTNNGKDKFVVTSNVNIVPDRYPFRPCYETNSCQP